MKKYEIVWATGNSRSPLVIEAATCAVTRNCQTFRFEDSEGNVVAEVIAGHVLYVISVEEVSQ